MPSTTAFLVSGGRSQWGSDNFFERLLGFFKERNLGLFSSPLKSSNYFEIWFKFP